MRNVFIAAVALLSCGCQQASVSEKPASQANSASLVAAPRFANAQEEDQFLVSMLKLRQFAKLDETLQAIQRTYEADPLTESQVDVAWGAFSRTGSEFRPLLDEWVGQMPKSDAARLARGSHFMHLGWSVRGSRFAAQTSSGQFGDMAQYHAAATRDFDAALAMNSRAVHVLIFKMDMAKAAGRRQEHKKLYEQALELNPLSLTARNWYLGGLQPRWGGSYEAMQAEIASARPLHEKNPRLKTLEGAILSDRAQVAINAHDYQEAYRLSSEALKYGVDSTTLRYKAEALIRMYQLAPAKNDLDAVLVIDPQGHRSHYLLGFIHMRQGNMEAAIKEFTMELELDQNDHKTLDTRGASYASMGNLKAALADFERASALDPDNREYQDDVKKAKRFIQQGR